MPVWLKGVREFVVIVAGVMIALFADGLREDWEDRRILSEYLGDVAAEVQANNWTLNNIETRVLPPKADALVRVVAFLRQPEAAIADTAALFADLVTSARPIKPWLTDDRYQALRSSGALRLLRDSELARDLAGFHQGPSILFAQADRSRGDFQAAVNAIIPIEVADDLSSMRGYTGVSLDLFPGAADYGAALERVRSRSEELLLLAQTEAVYTAAWGHALIRQRRNAEEMLDALEPWAADEISSGEGAG